MGTPNFCCRLITANGRAIITLANLPNVASIIAAGLAVYERGDYRHHATLYGNHDPKVCAHGELAQLLWMQGKPHSASEAERTALEWAELLDHHGSRLHASDTSLLYRVYRRDYQEVFRRSTELVNFTSTHALSDHHSKGLIFRGWITAVRDDPTRGLQSLAGGTGSSAPRYVRARTSPSISAYLPRR